MRVNGKTRRLLETVAVADEALANWMEKAAEILEEAWLCGIWDNVPEVTEMMKINAQNHRESAARMREFTA